MVFMNDLEWSMLSYYVIYYDKFRKVVHRTEKESLQITSSLMNEYNFQFTLMHSWLNFQMQNQIRFIFLKLVLVSLTVCLFMSSNQFIQCQCSDPAPSLPHVLVTHNNHCWHNGAINMEINANNIRLDDIPDLYVNSMILKANINLRHFHKRLKMWSSMLANGLEVNNNIQTGCGNWNEFYSPTVVGSWYNYNHSCLEPTYLL